MIIKFNREQEWNFKKLTHRKSQADDERKRYNTNIFGKWLLDLFKKYTNEVNGKYEVYPNFFMNQNNLNILQNHIGEWDYLNYAPILDDTLKDDEVKLHDRICKGGKL